ncbi:hypothetical protein N7479_008584, partial [Penicillium vulpinum]
MELFSAFCSSVFFLLISLFDTS